MNKRIIITGGTKGLGRAIAECFARNGFDVCVCARTEADLAAMHRDWEDYKGVQLITFAADMSKKSEVWDFAQFVLSKWSSFDVLVNNAGIFLPGAVSEESEGVLQTLLETNMYSAYHLTRALLPTLMAQKHGHVFNMCSVASLLAYPNGGSYSISKYALLGFSKALREEMKPKGIKVTAVMPGATWSDSWLGTNLPAERLMQASDIAKLVWAAYDLSDTAVVEDIIVRPQLGDL